MIGARTPLLLALVALLASGCASSPPKRSDNLCEIFREKPDWHQAAQSATDRWGTPIPICMAIMFRESSFRADVRPPRTRLLGVIPWKRPSDAYGYAQAKDATWDWYRNKSGNRGADRDDFDDAVDFIAWYGSISKKLANISQTDAYRQYLAYHEGHGGYRAGSYDKKPAVKRAAREVTLLADRYQSQYQSCRDNLPAAGWWIF